MSLTKVNYIDNSTIITAKNLNDIQDNIIEIQNDIKYHENLLDNSDFTNPINQRGKTIYESEEFMIDRWQSINAMLKIELGSNGIIISEHWLYQKIKKKTLKAGAAYTLAACEANGALSIINFTQGTSMIDNKIAYEVVNGFDRVRLYVGTWKWAALYEGIYTEETLPVYQPKGYETELLICRQYDINTGEYIGLRKFSQPVNLLDNSDFTNPINQRGETSYTGAVYTIDRWKGVNDSLKVDLGTNGITISGHWLYQVFDSKMLKTGGIYTLAACESDGTLSIINFTQGTTALLKKKICYEPVNGMDRVRLYTGTWKWAAVYEGAYTAETLPEYHPKGYGAELAECQRYYERINYGSTVKTIGNGYYAGTNTDARITINFAKKRIIPTVTLSLTDMGIVVGGKYTTISTTESIYPTDNNACIRFTTSEGVVRTSAALYGTGYIEISTEL